MRRSPLPLLGSGARSTPVGPDAVGVLASARQTNEDNYLTQKFARTVIGTNNVDCCARVCHAPSSTALKQMLGSGLSTNSFDDIEHAGAILVFGANATENHPIVGARIKQATRRRGAALIVVDPRRIELAHFADCHLAVRPGANVPLLNAMAHVIVAEHLVDRAFVDNRVSGYDAFAQFVKDWPPERVADICGVEADAIRTAARLYANTKPAMIVNGLGATEHVQGTDECARSSIWRCSPATSASPGLASTRSAGRTTCRVPRTWDANRLRCPERPLSKRRAARSSTSGAPPFRENAA